VLLVHRRRGVLLHQRRSRGRRLRGRESLSLLLLLVLLQLLRPASLLGGARAHQRRGREGAGLSRGRAGPLLAPLSGLRRRAARAAVAGIHRGAGRDPIADRVGLLLERRIDVQVASDRAGGGRRLRGAREVRLRGARGRRRLRDAALALLDDVRELVADQLHARRRVRIVGAGGEVEIVAGGEGIGADAGRLIAARVDADRREVGAELTLQLGAQRGRQATAGRGWIVAGGAGGVVAGVAAPEQAVERHRRRQRAGGARGSVLAARARTGGLAGGRGVVTCSCPRRAELLDQGVFARDRGACRAGGRA
jgi:hypothetical protein